MMQKPGIYIPRPQITPTQYKHTFFISANHKPINPYPNNFPTSPSSPSLTTHRCHFVEDIGFEPMTPSLQS